jgi:phosphoserine aminotransferase
MASTAFILLSYSSIGGIRASLYNAVTEEQVDKLVAYIAEFVETAGPPPLPSEVAKGQ